MTPVPVRYEESTEILLDSESVSEATGWTFGYGAINRAGALIAIHLECTFASGAAATVCTLPADFRPAATVTAGSFTIDSAGVVSYTGSTVTGASATLQVTYQAGTLAP